MGGGFGGPARTLAVEFGCHVTTIDLTDSYVRAAKALTSRMGLDDRVTHQVGNALILPFPDGAFDLLWTQNSGMNITDKESIYARFHSVLHPCGLLALQEPMAGPVQPVVYPLMWARGSVHELSGHPGGHAGGDEAAGFRARVEDMTGETSGPVTGRRCPPTASSAW